MNNGQIYNVYSFFEGNDAWLSMFFIHNDLWLSIMIVIPLPSMVSK